MAGSPKFKVYRGKEYIGCTKYAEDAAALCAVSNGGTVKHGHTLVVWREGHEEISAGESYDAARDIMLRRLQEHNGRRPRSVKQLPPA